MIELNAVTKKFGRNLAVRDLTLSVPSGQIYGLLGHNGAGKSTAIGMMLGQVWPTSGTVRICGHEVFSHRQRALSEVGAIFESPAFYDYLSGLRNLVILSSYTAPVPRKRIQEVLEWVGLIGVEHARVRTYSHGMRARLALAQALLPKPRLLILDEPSDGLDPEGIHDMRQTIQRLHRELGLTILLSSHFLVEVEQLCGRIAVLNRGRLVFEGSIADTRAQAQRVRVETADFDAAVRQLLTAGLISGAAEPGVVHLRDGVGTDALIRELVQANIPLYEICREQQTLEQFYLALMSGERNARAETQPHPMFLLHLRNELWKLFGKKRTYIGFGAFILAQNAMLLIFRFSHWRDGVERLLAGNGYIAKEYISALTVAVIMLIPQVILLMPLYAALVGGDLVAKEAEDGTLRMILCRPISRFRLLLAKWLAGGLFCISLVLALGGTALAFALIWFPWGNLFIFAPPEGVFNALSAGDGLRLFVYSHFFMALNASVILGIAFMFSCFNMKPAAATILALSFLFLNFVMEHLPFFEPYREWLLTYHFRVWLLTYAQPTPWDRMAQSICVLGAFSLTSFLIGAAAFQARDIKS